MNSSQVYIKNNIFKYKPKPLLSSIGTCTTRFSQVAALSCYYCTDVIIRDNNISDYITAIQLINNSNAIINRNNISDARGNAIYAYLTHNLTFANNVVVNTFYLENGNILISGECGIFYHLSTNIHIFNNKISGYNFGIQSSTSSQHIIGNNISWITFDAISCGSAYSFAIRENYIAHAGIGIAIYSTMRHGTETTAEILDNIITNSSSTGIRCADVYDQIKLQKNKLVNNSYGIMCTNTQLTITNNTIIFNHRDGIYAEKSVLVAKDNLIAANGAWGIHIVDSDLSELNTNFGDQMYPLNRYGRLWAEFIVQFQAIDRYGKGIINATVTVIDRDYNNIWTGYTYIDGRTYLINLTDYKVFNNGTKLEWFPYIVHSAWKNSTNKTTITERPVIPLPLKIVLELPDIYISPDDIQLSDDHPTVGDTIVIEATVHNHANIQVENVNVTITIDGNIIKELTIDSIAPYSVHTIRCKWNVWAIDGGDMSIKVRVEPPEGFEYDVDYHQNNVASRNITIKTMPMPTIWAIRGSEPVILFTIAIIIILILVIICYKIKKKTKQKDGRRNV
jgi:hypothetical protein